MTTATRSRNKRVPEDALPERLEVDWRQTYAVLSFDELFVDQEYQRPLTSMADKIAKQFDPLMWQAAIVSKRADGRYAIVDGQNRIEGARRIGVKEGPCLIYVDLPPEVEADLFARYQDERRSVTPLIRFRARLKAGNPEAHYLNDLVTSTGFVWSDQQRVGTVRAVRAIERIRERDLATDRNDLPVVLQLVKDAWPDSPYATAEAVLYGVQEFLKRLDAEGKELDEDRFVRTLGRVQPSELAVRANKLREARGLSARSPKLMAEAMEHEYRKTGRPKRAE